MEVQTEIWGALLRFPSAFLLSQFSESPGREESNRASHWGGVRVGWPVLSGPGLLLKGPGNR